MADKCFGCLNKYKFREKPTLCSGCRKHFCNKCLDRKKVETDGAKCPYCTHKQQRTNKEEESQILENFQERYYRHKNQGPPIVTRLQFDPKMTQVANKSSDYSSDQTVSGVLSEEDKELEQRFNKLRQDRKTEAPSLAELQNQFDKFQGKDSSTQDNMDTANNSGSGQTSSKTKSEFEQTQNLIQQMKEEAELESKLESHGKQQEQDLATRFNALQDKKDNPQSHVVTAPESQNTEMTSTTCTSNNQSIEDPQQLLNDLKGMANREEESILQELKSSDVQSLVSNIKPSCNETTFDTPYPPILEDVTPAKPKPQVSEEELQRLIAQAKMENEQEAQTKARDDEFHLHISNKVSSLMADSDSDSDVEVKSKPKKDNTKDQGGLDFRWNHFESTSGRGTQSSDNNKWDFDDDEEFDQQVQSLIQEMSEEVKLEESLEAHGMSHMINTQPTPTNSSNTTGKLPVTTTANIPTGAIASASGGNNNDDELPWCCMCNLNANVRCFDCDDDLYCVPCFSQCHERFELFDHRYVPYEPTYKP